MDRLSGREKVIPSSLFSATLTLLPYLPFTLMIPHHEPLLSTQDFCVCPTRTYLSITFHDHVYGCPGYTMMHGSITQSPATHAAFCSAFAAHLSEANNEVTRSGARKILAHTFLSPSLPLCSCFLDLCILRSATTPVILAFSSQHILRITRFRSAISFFVSGCIVISHAE